MMMMPRGLEMNVSDLNQNNVVNNRNRSFVGNSDIADDNNNNSDDDNEIYIILTVMPIRMILTWSMRMYS